MLHGTRAALIDIEFLIRLTEAEDMDRIGSAGFTPVYPEQRTIRAGSRHTPQTTMARIGSPRVTLTIRTAATAFLESGLIAQQQVFFGFLPLASTMEDLNLFRSFK